MIATETEKARIAELAAQRREQLLNTPEIRALKASEELSVALAILSRKKRRPRRKWDYPQQDLETWVFNAVRKCMAEPDLAERMTAGERRALSASIEYHAESLWELLSKFAGSDGRFGWPFQPILDALALDLSVDYVKGFDLPEEELEEVEHRSRYAIYYLLMDRIEDVLGAFVECGQSFAETNTIIKKPHDPNAKRLYFLRRMTGALVSEFRSPCRGVALALANVFFNCDDLDEASISKLAPVVKPVPVEIPLESLQHLAAMVEKQISALGDADPEKLEELNDHLNFYRGLIEKSSA